MCMGNLERAVETYAFAHVLDRLRALRVIDYVFERREVHIGVGPDAERLLPLQEALVSGPRG